MLLNTLPTAGPVMVSTAISAIITRDRISTYSISACPPDPVLEAGLNQERHRKWGQKRFAFWPDIYASPPTKTEQAESFC